MTIFFGSTKVKPAGIARAYLGDTLVYQPSLTWQLIEKFAGDNYTDKMIQDNIKSGDTIAINTGPWEYFHLTNLQDTIIRKTTVDETKIDINGMGGYTSILDLAWTDESTASDRVTLTLTMDSGPDQVFTLTH